MLTERHILSLFFIDFVAELLECGVAYGRANCKLFSQLLLFKMIDPITVSLCFLIHLSLGHSPLWLRHYCTFTLVFCSYFAGITLVLRANFAGKSRHHAFWDS